MGTFTVYGFYGSDDPTPEQGRVTVIPSVLPLVSTVDNTVVASPIIFKVDKGVVRLEGLPAKGDYQPEFSLTWVVKLNSGFTDSFEFMPEAAGVEVPLSALQTVPFPLPPGGELEYSLEVLAARDAANTARDQALAIVATLNMAAGVPGPAGPPGPAGANGLSTNSSVEFSFSSAITPWLLPHNLGRRLVDLVAVDLAGNEVIGDPVFVDVNNARIDWYYPMTGSVTASL